MWILIDNEDSFSHILWDYIRRFHSDTIIISINEGKNLDDIIAMHPQRIIISPGPGKPEDALLSNQVMQYFYDKIPILGICLGHQILGLFFGAQCQPSGQPLHGKTSQLQIIQSHPVFDSIPEEQLQITHYHSLVVKNHMLTELQAIAVDEQQQLMAIAHPIYPIFGMQFHPESILTTAGEQMIQNWVNMDWK